MSWDGVSRLTSRKRYVGINVVLKQVNHVPNTGWGGITRMVATFCRAILNGHMTGT